MARVRFLDFPPEVFVDQVKKKLGMNAGDLARVCEVNRRSFSDWQRGRYLMPKFVFDKLVELSEVEEFGEIEILPDHWSKRDSGRKGGRLFGGSMGRFLDGHARFPGREELILLNLMFVRILVIFIN